MMKNFKITSAALMLAVVLSAGKCGKDQTNAESPVDEISTEATATENQPDQAIAPTEEINNTEETSTATPGEERVKKEKEVSAIEHKK